MPELAVDLGSPKFWLLFGVALILLVPLSSPPLKRVVFASINLLFIFSLVGSRGVAAALAIVAFVWCVARGAARRERLAYGVFAGLVLSATFLLHKLPAVGFLAPAGPVKVALAGVGFSFVTLRVIEVLRAVFESTQPAPGVIALLNYLLPFHMLAAGPIQSYDDYVSADVVGPPLRADDVIEAVDRMASGLFKKFVLAHVLKTIALTGFQANGGYFFLEAQVYYVWVYIDFSAYSDIAVGVGRLLGVRTPENFDRPLFARNIVEFWERWHISLSQFIRRNVFVPLQVAAMRRRPEASPLPIACVAFTIAFLLCGLWHGLNVRCIGWGAIHAFGLIVCSVYKHALQKRLGRKGLIRYLELRSVRLLATVLTFEFVAFSLVFISYPFE